MKLSDRRGSRDQPTSKPKHAGSTPGSSSGNARGGIGAPPPRSPIVGKRLPPVSPSGGVAGRVLPSVVQRADVVRSRNMSDPEAATAAAPPPKGEWDKDGWDEQEGREAGAPPLTIAHTHTHPKSFSYEDRVHKHPARDRYKTGEMGREGGGGGGVIE